MVAKIAEHVIVQVQESVVWNELKKKKNYWSLSLNLEVSAYCIKCVMQEIWAVLHMTFVCLYFQWWESIVGSAPSKRKATLYRSRQIFFTVWTCLQIQVPSYYCHSTRLFAGDVSLVNILVQIDKLHFVKQ